ncbi:hypothetical protein N9X15_04925 [Flavobacteriaceae bacterium]|nr:hypothetical protein [Flavobacteriaceae bacterium]
MRIFKKKSIFKSVAVMLSLAVLNLSFASAPVEQVVVLKSGTVIPLETINVIKSDNATVGRTIDLRVTRDVEVDGQTVIPAGSIAKGQITRSQKAKGLGKAGFLEIQIKSVTAVDGQEVYLAGGNVSEEGDDKATLAIVLGLFVCILFLFMKGKNAEIPPGFSFDSNVASTINIQV